MQKDIQQAINSSILSVSANLMPMLRLRILAGASYLDIIHYDIHVDSVQKIVWRTVLAIHKYYEAAEFKREIFGNRTCMVKFTVEEDGQCMYSWYFFG